MKFPKLNQKILRIGIAGFLFLSVIGSTVFTVHPVSASPTDAYWVGGSGDWSDATNHWATTSGGSPNSANLPASTTNVHFDGNSGSSITVNGAGEIYCNNMDWTGSVGIPTLNLSSYRSGDLYISGNAVFAPSMEIPISSYLTDETLHFNTSTTQTITTNGAIFAYGGTAGQMYFDGTGTYTLEDNLYCQAGSYPFLMQLVSGTLNTNGKTITTGWFELTGSSARSLILGTSIINCTQWVAESNNLTNSFTSSTINVSNAYASAFSGADLTYGIVNIQGSMTISGNNTFNNLNIARTAGTVQFTASSTQTCTTFTAPPSGTTNLTLESTSGGTAWNLIQTSGTVITDYITMQDSHASGGANFYAGDNSTDVSGNTGWTFHSPPSITTSTASPVTGASANLRGTIDIFGGYSPISVSFNYATDAYYVAHSSTYSDSTVAQPFTTQAVPITVQQTVPYLLATTEYHYQMQVSWVQGGTTIYEYGADSTFVTTNYPYAETLDATGITSTTATLNGNLLSLGTYTSVSVSFHWGSTTSYGNTTSPVTMTALGTFSVPLTTSDGISNGQTYHYQAIVTYADVSSPQYGADVAFTVGLNGSLTITIGNVGIFHNYITNSPTAPDTLVVMEVVCNYSTVFKSKTASACFQIQLLDTDNSTILGVGMLQQWGDRPESIYLNAAVTTAKIVDDSAYYIKVIGYNVTGNPSEEYLVQSDDWYGSDLTQLDSMIIRTGNAMALTDTTTYTAVLADGNQQITDNAVGFFTIGIPDITNIRPNDFTSSALQTKFPSTASNNQWDSATAWTTNVGTNISTDANLMGTPFGITGKDFLAAIIWIIVLFIVGVVTMGGGKPLPAFLLCIPIIWLGTYWKILPVQQIIAICIIFFFFGVRQFFIKTT